METDIKLTLVAALWFAMMVEVCCDYTDFMRWNFDVINGTYVVPSVNTGSKFYADLTPLGTDLDAVLPEGVVGNAVYVDGKSFNLATNLQSTCLRDPDACGSGFLIGSWLKLVNWNSATNPVIFRTTTIERSTAGVYLGKGSGNNLLFYVRGSSGKTYSSSFSQTDVWNQWGYVVILWTKTDGHIFVSVNGTFWVSVTTPGTAEVTTVTPADFVVGDENGPTFYLDQFAVQYISDTTTTTAITTTSTSPTTSTTTGVTTPTATTTTTVTTSTASPTTTVTTSTALPTTTTTAMSYTTSIAQTPIVPTNDSATAGVMNTTHGNGNVGLHANFWIPILIAALALLVLATCLVWLCCCYRSKKKGSDNISARQESIPLSVTNKGYARASTIEPYHDDASNMETDDNHTEQEDHSPDGRLV